MAGFVGGQGVADVDVFKAGETNDIARDGGFGFTGAETGELELFLS